MPKTWEYTLTGFGGSLERRRVAFLEPVPSLRVCCVCGLLPYHIRMLPCGHGFCLLCEKRTAKDKTCPTDRLKYVEDRVVSVYFALMHLERRRVRCGVAGTKCDFDGTLYDMQCHISECVADRYSCDKCCRSVVRGKAIDHCRRCYGGESSAAEASTVFDKLGVIKKDVESLRRQCAPSGDAEPQSPDVDVINTAMGLVEDLQNDLRQMASGSGSTDHGSTVQDAEVLVGSGPYRAAPKQGVFVTTYVFKEVHSFCTLVSGEEMELDIASEPCTLAGYTFRVKCHMASGKGQDVRVHFVLFLQNGEWDDIVDWPFAKKVTMALAHPTDLKRDILLPVTAAEHDASANTPVPGVPDIGYKTDDVEWNVVLERGFVSSGKLHVTVQFE